MTAACTLCGQILDGGSGPAVEDSAKLDMIEWRRLMLIAQMHFAAYHSDWLSEHLGAWVPVLMDVGVSRALSTYDERFEKQRALVAEALAQWAVPPAPVVEHPWGMGALPPRPDA